MPDGALMALSGVSAGYGPRRVLHDVELTMPGGGGVLALVGHNGAGKTTALRVIAGLKQPDAGEVVLFGADASRMSAAARARAGLALVPEGVQGVFPTLTVAQNLAAAGAARRRGDVLGGLVRDAFGEVLVDRRDQIAGSMSGGQRQMLAISIALFRRPRLLLLDEPSTGLAPRIVQRIFAVIGELAQRTETAVVVVEQDLKAALSIATRVCVLQAGEIVAEFAASDCPPSTELWRFF